MHAVQYIFSFKKFKAFFDTFVICIFFEKFEQTVDCIQESLYRLKSWKPPGLAKLLIIKFIAIQLFLNFVHSIAQFWAVFEDFINPFQKTVDFFGK